MKLPDRIALDPAIIGGKPCVCGTRVTVRVFVGLLGRGRDRDEILTVCPYLRNEDIDEGLEYAAWRVDEKQVLVAGG